MIVIARNTIGMLVLLSIGACRTSESKKRDSTTSVNEVASDSTASRAACGVASRRLIAQFGERMRLVSLLAPETVVRREIADAYSQLASPELIAEWQSSPASAPGRDVSSPWPLRIEVRSLNRAGRNCRAEGDVLYVTNADTMAVVERRAVTIEMDSSDSRIIAYHSTAPNTGVSRDGSRGENETAPSDVVRRYYGAIAAHDYDQAYALWGQSGRASGKTRADFAAGFANTAEVRATITDSARIEGAAGSQYATVPVVVNAVLSNGQKQRFTGTYTLRRSMVDGATPAQRVWHIYTADLTPTVP